MKYKITAVVEQDNEYMNAEQIQELVSDIRMGIADYNCFRIIENVEAEEYRPDMREKVKEYISELDEEISRCIDQEESILAAIGDYDEKPMPIKYIELEERIKTLNEVKCDLESRLEELV